MKKEDEDSDEDEAFLHASMEILEGLSRGDEVIYLAENLEKPMHSFDPDATDCIYNALKVIARSSQNGAFRSSIVSSPTPDKLNDCSGNDLEHDEFGSDYQLDRSELSYSPTRQIGNLENGQEIYFTSEFSAPLVPRLTLELSPTSSVQHSPLLTTREDPVTVDTLKSRSSFDEVSHCCHQCHTRQSTLNLSDFLYLFFVGLGISLILYYFYIPPLHKGPVF